MRDETVVTSDPIGGRRITLHKDRVDGSLTSVNEQDVTQLVELNKARYNVDDKHTRFKRGNFIMVASLPANLWFELKKKGILDDKKAFSRWLNDPENRFFRTAPGKV